VHVTQDIQAMIAKNHATDIVVAVMVNTHLDVLQAYQVLNHITVDAMEVVIIRGQMKTQDPLGFVLTKLP